MIATMPPPTVAQQASLHFLPFFAFLLLRRARPALYFSPSRCLLLAGSCEIRFDTDDTRLAMRCVSMDPSPHVACEISHRMHPSTHPTMHPSLGQHRNGAAK